MAAQTPTSVSRFQKLNQWWVPFGLVLVLPIASHVSGVAMLLLLADANVAGLPASCFSGGMLWGAYLGGDAPQMYFAVVPAMMSFGLLGLLNLTPFIWALSTRAEVRTAGILSGLLGMFHLAIPLFLLGFMPLVTSPAGKIYFQSCTGDWVPEHVLLVASSVGLGIAVWLTTLLVARTFTRVRSKTKSVRRKVAESAAGALVIVAVAAGAVTAVFATFYLM